MARPLTLSLVTLLAFALAGCSSDGDSTTEPDGATGTAEGTDSTGAAPPSAVGTTGAPSVDSTSTTDGGDVTTTGSDTTDTGTETDETTTGLVPLCGDTDGACVPEGPKSWSPPQVIRTDAENKQRSMCNDRFPSEVGRTYASPVVPPAQCECACELADDVICDSASVDYVGNCDCFSVFNCPILETYQVDTNSCTQPVNQGVPAWWIVELDPPTGSCDPVAVEAFPEPYYEDRVTACTGQPLEATCDFDETCFPQLQPNEQWCSWQAGDVECPAGPFNERTVYYEGFEDTRSCEACGCGQLEGSCESDQPSSGWVALHTGADCPPGWDTSLSPGVGNTSGCSTSPSPGLQVIGSMNLGGQAHPVASCEPTHDGTPLGEAVPLIPVTSCCIPN